MSWIYAADLKEIAFRISDIKIADAERISDGGPSGEGYIQFGKTFIFRVYVRISGQPQGDLKGLVEALGRDIAFPKGFDKLLPAV